MNASVEIRPITKFEPAPVRPILDAGYVSPSRYRVRKTETPESTVIRLELEQLPTPYVKTWEMDAEDCRRLEAMLPDGYSLAAYVEDQLVGVAICELRAWNRTLWIWEFHIDPAWQGQGIGRQLMEAVAAKAKAARLRILALETQSTNVPAISFYRAMGFEIDSLDLSFYTNHDTEEGGEVAIFMKRKLE